MTAPTWTEVWEWARKTGLTHATPERLERFAALAFAAGSRSSSTDNAELVPELEQIEEALTDSVRAFEASGMNPKMQNRALWSFMRLRTALLSGSRSGEDARDAARWRAVRKWLVSDDPPRYLLESYPVTEDVVDVVIDAAMGGNDAKS